MSARARPLALLTFCGLVAALPFGGVSCASLQSASGVLSSLFSGPDPRSPAEELATERAMREKTRMREDDSELHPSTCFLGVVSSPGPVGEPLEAVDIEVAFASNEPRPYFARTDAHGEFHVCIERQSRGEAIELLTGSPRFTDRTEAVHLVFSRPGWSTRDRDLVLDTADRDRSLDVALDREETRPRALFFRPTSIPGSRVR